jgi:hypothetical protein
VLEFRNTPRANGASPAKMFFGHQTRSIIPAYRTSFADKWKAVMDARDRQAEIDAVVKTRNDASTKPKSRLPVRQGCCLLLSLFLCVT